jgi:hypothetical protein
VKVYALVIHGIDPDGYDGWITYGKLRGAILAHPTLVEGLIPLFLSAPSLSVNLDAQAADHLQYENVEMKSKQQETKLR